jgi:hypothetical protein
MIMDKFNKSHSALISQIYDLPFYFEMYLERKNDPKYINESTINYNEVIERFKKLTVSFPHDFDFDTDDCFQLELGEIPYSIITRTLHDIISKSLNLLWKLHQVDEQFVPFIHEVFKIFPELDFGKPATIEKRNIQISSKVQYFMNCSRIQSKDNDFNVKIDAKIKKSIASITKNYNGRYDELPSKYAGSLIQKLIHIKVIAIRKRNPLLFKSHT